MKTTIMACAGLLAGGLLPMVATAAEEETEQSIEERLEALEQELEETREQLNAVKSGEPNGTEISTDFNEFGGAFWTNFAWRDYSETSKSRGGDFRIDLFRLDVNGREGNVIWSAQHRWYQYMDVIHHAWVGYQFDDDTDMAIGISQAPFGIQPYASHSYWFGVPYYVGLEDDYDTGVRYRTKSGNLDIQLGFYSNPEYASPGVVGRYSFDIVSDGIYNNEEINQGNIRLAYDIPHGDDSNTEIGLSARRGQLFNSDTDLTGDHWAAALHLDGDYGPWGIELEAIRYEYNPEYAAGLDTRKLANGAFAASYIIAAKADLYIANVTRDFSVDWGPVSNLRCYSDYSVLKKDPAGWEDTELHTLGCGISAGSVYTFVDFIRGKNHHFLGTTADIAFAEGEQDPRWKTRFNINIEVYF